MKSDNEAGGPAIARYFFDTSNRESRPDRVGVELAGPEQAQVAAVRTRGEILQDLDGAFWGDPAWRMEVTNEEGRAVCILRVTGERGKP